MDNIYDAPDSKLGELSVHYFGFSSLGFWRKLYVVLNWIFGVGIALLIQFSPFISLAQNDEGGVSLIQMLILSIFGGIILLYTYWMHKAVSTRNITQITILAVIQVVPLMNLIGLLIMLAIRATSKSEIEAAQA